MHEDDTALCESCPLKLLTDSYFFGLVFLWPLSLLHKVSGFQLVSASKTGSLTHLGVLTRDNRSNITSPLITERNRRLNYQQKPWTNNHPSLSVNPPRGLGERSNTLIYPACSEQTKPDPIRAVNVILHHQTPTGTSMDMHIHAEDIIPRQRGSQR